MGYEKMIAASIKVVKPNYLELHPGGWYDMSEDNHVELAVVKFHMLSQFCDMMAESYACTSENQILLGDEAEALATKLYNEYKPFIEAGCNIFEHDEFYDRKTLDKYKTRPIVNGYMNAGPEDRLSGLPDGWWCEFPGQYRKMFNEYFVAIDYDECVQIGFYNTAKSEDPSDMIFITAPGDFRAVYRHYREHAAEISTVCDHCYEQYHI